MKSNKTRTKAVASALALLLSAALFLSLAPPGRAASLLSAASSVTVSPSPRGVSDFRTASHSAIRVVKGGKTVCTGRLIDGWATVPIRFFCDAVLPGCNVRYTSSNRTMTVEGGGVSLSATDGSRVLYVNGRCLYSDLPITILDDGRMYATVWVMAKALGVSAGWNGTTGTVSLSGNVRPLENGSTYYNGDDLYWLSRIISAESRGESLIGQIAVGNVVLNRVRSAEFPGSIYGVIFDRKYGVQFTPVANGTVYNAPATSAVTAAKICLEGYTVSTSALYFLNPAIAGSFWISRNRPYLFTIGRHAFYR